MTTKEQVLQNCTIQGTIVKLPPSQLDRKLYQDVAKSLELIGGKWKGGKVAGFVFPQDRFDFSKLNKPLSYIGRRWKELKFLFKVPLFSVGYL